MALLMAVNMFIFFFANRGRLREKSRTPARCCTVAAVRMARCIVRCVGVWEDVTL
jgi:hypothetical protein